MKKVLMLAMILTFVVFGSAFAQTPMQAVKNAPTKTIKGEVIDISCYVAAGAKGESHKTCALTCLQAGEPAGILEDGTGKVYLVISEDHVTNPSKKMIPYVAKKVEATGTVNDRGGITVIDIKNIKEISSMASQTMGTQQKGMTGTQQKSTMGAMGTQQKSTTNTMNQGY